MNKLVTILEIIKRGLGGINHKINILNEILDGTKKACLSIVIVCDEEVKRKDLQS
jgi:hypothetical protein